MTLARPKSRTFDVAIWRDLDVGRFQIPVNDAVLVCRVECSQSAARDPGHLRSVEASRRFVRPEYGRRRARAPVPEHRRHLATHRLRQCVDDSALPAGAASRSKRARRSGSAMTSSGRIFTATSRPSFDIACAIHFAHAAGSELADDLILTKACADAERHVLVWSFACLPGSFPRSRTRLAVAAVEMAGPQRSPGNAIVVHHGR